MSIDVDLVKFNFNDYVKSLMKKIPKINNENLLREIILEFGNKVGDDIVLLHNEFWESGICDWNMFTMIQEIFELTEDEYDDVSTIFYRLNEYLNGYKEIDEAYENLGLERKELEEDEE